MGLEQGGAPAAGHLHTAPAPRRSGRARRTTNLHPRHARSGAALCRACAHCTELGLPRGILGPLGDDHQAARSGRSACLSTVGAGAPSPCRAEPYGPGIGTSVGSGRGGGAVSGGDNGISVGSGGSGGKGISVGTGSSVGTGNSVGPGRPWDAGAATLVDATAPASSPPASPNRIAKRGNLMPCPPESLKYGGLVQQEACPVEHPEPAADRGDQRPKQVPPTRRSHRRSAVLRGESALAMAA